MTGLIIVGVVLGLVNLAGLAVVFFSTPVGMLHRSDPLTTRRVRRLRREVGTFATMAGQHIREDRQRITALERRMDGRP